MKLELKHLTPYLPYSLRIKTKHGWDTMTTLNEWQVNGDHEDSYSYEDHPNEILEFKPILRPLSDLTKEIDVNGEKFVSADRLGWKLNITPNPNQEKGLGYWLCNCTYANSSLIDMQLLFEWHFDVFGLIEKGLAIDINKI